MDISLNIVLLLAVIAIASCVLYGIGSVSHSTRRDAEIKHQEFEDSFESGHRERMARIAAERDADIAKATHQQPKPPSKQIEG